MLPLVQKKNIENCSNNIISFYFCFCSYSKVDSWCCCAFLNTILVEDIFIYLFNSSFSSLSSSSSSSSYFCVLHLKGSENYLILKACTAWDFIKFNYLLFFCNRSTSFVLLWILIYFILFFLLIFFKVSFCEFSFGFYFSLTVETIEPQIYQQRCLYLLKFACRL